MTEVLLTNAVITTGYALFAVMMAWMALRVLDRMGKINFQETVARITYEPKSAAIYFGLRFIGVCLLFGMVIS